MFYLCIFIIAWLLILNHLSKKQVVVNLSFKNNEKYDDSTCGLFVGLSIIFAVFAIPISIGMWWYNTVEIEDYLYRDFLEAEWSTEVIKKNKFMEDGKITGSEYREIMSHAPKWRDHVKLKVK